MLKNILLGLSVLSNLATLAGLWIAYISVPATVQNHIGHVLLISGAVCSVLLYLGLAWFVLQPRKRPPSEHSPKITVLATSSVYDSNNPAIRYPLKMNIEMRNDSSECIDVQLAGYKPGIGELKKFVTAVLRLNFSGKLFPPVDGESRIAVLHGQQFHAWLGFDEKKVTKEQLGQNRGKIGILTLIVNGQNVDISL
jgi:hypothetical protein